MGQSNLLFIWMRLCRLAPRLSSLYHECHTYLLTHIINAFSLKTAKRPLICPIFHPPVCPQTTRGAFGNFVWYLTVQRLLHHRGASSAGRRQRWLPGNGGTKGTSGFPLFPGQGANPRGPCLGYSTDYTSQIICTTPLWEKVLRIWDEIGPLSSIQVFCSGDWFVPSATLHISCVATEVGTALATADWFRVVICPWQPLVISDPFGR